MQSHFVVRAPSARSRSRKAKFASMADQSPIASPTENFCSSISFKSPNLRSDQHFCILASGEGSGLDIWALQVRGRFYSQTVHFEDRHCHEVHSRFPFCPPGRVLSHCKVFSLSATRTYNDGLAWNQPRRNRIADTTWEFAAHHCSVTLCVVFCCDSYWVFGGPCSSRQPVSTIRDDFLTLAASGSISS